MTHRWIDEIKVSWLGTGDAEFGDDGVAGEFLDHMATQTRSVVCMSVPHHGSTHNHSPAVIRDIDPSILFVTCPTPRPSKPPKHPAPSVVAHLAKWCRAPLLQVAESETSELHEWVEVIDLR